MKLTIIILTLGMFLFSFASATTFGYNYLDNGINSDGNTTDNYNVTNNYYNVTQNITNNITKTINATVNETQFDSNNPIHIMESWLESFINSISKWSNYYTKEETNDTIISKISELNIVNGTDGIDGQNGTFTGILNETQFNDNGTTWSVDSSWLESFINAISKWSNYATIDEPLWTSNYSAYNEIWSSTYNDTWINETFYNQIYIDDRYSNNTGDQDLSSFITNESALAYVNSTGLIINWSEEIGEGGNSSFNQTLTDSLYSPIGYGDDWNKTYADTLYSTIDEPLWASNYSAYNESWSIDTDTIYTAGTGLTLTGTEFTTNDSQINHDDLSNFVANEHIDWTNSASNFKTSGTTQLNGGVVINEDGADKDFRVETNTYDNTLFVDGGSNNVGILNNAPNPNFALDVNGQIKSSFVGSGNINVRVLGPKYGAMQITGGGSSNENMPASLLLLQTSMSTTSDRGPEIYFVGTRSTTAQVNSGVFTPLTTGKHIGAIYFGGDDGVNQRGVGAVIRGMAVGNWTSTSHPAQLSLWTTPSGSTSAVERFDIQEDGDIVSSGIYNKAIGGTNRDVYVDNSGYVGYVSSSIRYKENLRNLSEYSEKIYNLKPVLFDYKNKEQGINQFGLIAEEVEKVMPELVSYKAEVEYTPEGKVSSITENKSMPETVSYGKLVPLLLNEIIKLNDKVTELDNQVNDLEKRIALLEKG